MRVRARERKTYAGTELLCYYCYIIIFSPHVMKTFRKGSAAADPYCNRFHWCLYNGYYWRYGHISHTDGVLELIHTRRKPYVTHTPFFFLKGPREVLHTTDRPIYYDIHYEHTVYRYNVYTSYYNSVIIIIYYTRRQSAFNCVFVHVYTTF